MIKEGKIYGTDEFEVKIGKTQTIIPIQERHCPAGFIFKLLNGEIVVGGAMSGVDYPTDGDSVPLPPGQTSRALSWRRSKDGGETWQETPAWPSYGVHQFEDGEIMCLSGRWWYIESGERWKYSVARFFSTDNGYTFQKKRIPIFGVLKLAKVNRIQHSKWERYANINHQVVLSHNGNLLASVQGKFEDDIKERTFIIASDDRGKTWHYISTVAFDLTPVEIRPLGFDEPNLLVLPSGEILCFMRTGSKKGNPIYISRSSDNGLTWSCVEPITDLGVYPTACLMKNGIIVVIYGRPGDWLTFSLNQGETWINHFCFNQTSNPYDCGNYDWIEEVAPDTLFAVYGRTDSNDYMRTEIVGTFFTVKPK